MRVLSRESVFCSLLAFLCWGVGLVCTAVAFDPSASKTSKWSQNEFSAQLEYWPAKCGELEKSGTDTEASRCWWYGAEALNRYAAGDHPQADSLEEIRKEWLWRGVRLSLRRQEPEPEPEPLESSVIEPATVVPGGQDIAPLASSDSCPTGLSDDREDCRAEATEVPIPRVKPVKPRKKPAKVSKKKKSQPKVAKAKAKAKTKPKTETAQAVPKAPKKKVAGKISVRKAALPLAPEMQKKTNVACPPTNPCIGRRLPTASLR